MRSKPSSAAAPARHGPQERRTEVPANDDPQPAPGMHKLKRSRQHERSRLAGVVAAYLPIRSASGCPPDGQLPRHVSRGSTGWSLSATCHEVCDGQRCGPHYRRPLRCAYFDHSAAPRVRWQPCCAPDLHFWIYRDSPHRQGRRRTKQAVIAFTRSPKTLIPTPCALRLRRLSLAPPSTPRRAKARSSSPDRLPATLPPMLSSRWHHSMRRTSSTPSASFLCMASRCN